MLNTITDKIKHFATSVHEFLTSVYGWLTMLLTIIITNNTTMLFSFLITMLVCDYITGIIASYAEKDKKAKVYIIESKRLRESGVKVIGYLLVVILAWFVSKNIYVDNIKLFGVIREFSVLEIALVICAGVEAWSNLENMKRAGFDIVGKLENIIKKIWEL